MKLLLLDDYYSQRGGWAKGQEIEVDDRLGQWLLNDAPGCFEVIPYGLPDAPPVDKMIKKPARKK